MKKYLIFLLLLCASLAQARSTVVVVGGPPATGGAGASGYYDPDGMVSNENESWEDNASSTSNLNQAVDDAVRTPTDAETSGDGAYLTAQFDATDLVLSIADVSGSITTVRVWIFGNDKGNGAVFQTNISGDGSTWSTAQGVNLGDEFADRGWVSKDFSVSWNGTTDFRLLLERTGAGNGENIYVAAVYVEINP